MTKEEIQRFCASWDAEILLADGFEDAFVGVGQKFHKVSAVYDWDKCVDVLVKRDGMTLEDAIEYLEFNVLDAWVGDHTPIFLERVGEKEVDENDE